MKAFKLLTISVFLLAGYFAGASIAKNSNPSYYSLEKDVTNLKLDITNHTDGSITLYKIVKDNNIEQVIVKIPEDTTKREKPVKKLTEYVLVDRLYVPVPPVTVNLLPVPAVKNVELSL